MLPHLVGMSRVHLKTNGHRRPLVSFSDMPSEGREWFNYITADEEHDPRFFEYRGSWYDTFEFEGIPARSRSTRRTCAARLPT